MSGKAGEEKNNGWHLKNGNKAAAPGAAEEGEERAGMGKVDEEEEEAEKAAPFSRKRARSSGSISSELSTDSHGAKRARVNIILVNLGHFKVKVVGPQ